MHPIGTNVTIEASPIVEGVTLEEVLAIAVGNMVSLGFKEASRTEIESPPGYLIEGEFTVEEGIPVLITLVITLNESYSIVAGFSVLPSLQELHQPILDSMLASFRTFPSSPPPPDDHGDNAGVATEISVGESVTAVVDSQLDVDYFSFQGIAGDTYQASVALDTLNDAILLLRSEGGTCILTGSVNYSDSQAPFLRWNAQVDNTYYLSVENSAGVSTGTYTLTLTLTTTTEAPTDDHGNNSCSATAINPDQQITGNIEEPAEVDWFSFQADAGTTYTITVSLGTLDDSLLALWDTKGETVLESNDDFGLTLASRIQWTAPQSRTYFLSVENADAVSTGTYTLMVTGQGQASETPPSPTATTASSPAPTPTPEPTAVPPTKIKQYSQPPAMTIQVDKRYVATINTNKGAIVIELLPKEAPKTVNSFVFLAGDGYYDGVIFHRVIKDFMIQGGDPTGIGRGGPGYKFEDEFAPTLVFDRSGLLAMANAGPNTNGSQFFITVVPTPYLNGNHTIFGRVLEGQDVADAISLVVTGAGDKPLQDVIIESIEIKETES